MRSRLEPIYTKDDLVFILGGGPSIENIDLSVIHNYPVIGTNAAFYFGTWVDICVFVDGRFYTWNREALEAWPNRIITCDPNLESHPKIEYVKKCTEHSLCWNPNKLACPEKGKNVGSSAIALAANLGAQNIVLLGYDMKTKDGRHNYHNYHEHTPRDDVYNRFMKHYIPLSEELEKAGINVINATPNSALKLFSKMSLRKVLNGAYSAAKIQGKKQFQDNMQNS